MDVLEKNETSIGESDTPVPPTEGKLDLVIIDPLGFPIKELSYKLFVNNAVVSEGATDAKGKIKTVDNLKIGCAFDIHVKTDLNEYKKVATGTIKSTENYACLSSPLTRIEIDTLPVKGDAGTAAQNKKKVLKKHNQTPDSKPVITGNPDTPPSVKVDRDEHGFPFSAVIYGLLNWLGVNSVRATPLKLSEMDKLKTLNQFMEDQAKLNYRSLHSHATEYIVKQMIRRSLSQPANKLPKDPNHLCATYVKVGLWYAGYGPADKEIGRGVGPARDMGPALTHQSAGFRNVSSSLPKIKITVGNTTTAEQPDITFALPGDVIVYQKRTDPTADGHIDVRTYHGFISDFVWPGRNGLPDLRLYKVTGVYRKYTDTVAEARVKAFLRIIRENVTKGADDPYRALDKVGDKFNTFTDMSKHPSNAKEDNPAGAYQIAWKIYDRDLQATAWPRSFEKIDQDRLAIYELQGRVGSESHPKRTALGYIMEGKVDQAINDTKLWKLFSFLPGGGKDQLIEMKDLKQKFEKYTSEYEK